MWGLHVMIQCDRSDFITSSAVRGFISEAAAIEAAKKIQAYYSYLEFTAHCVPIRMLEADKAVANG